MNPAGHSSPPLLPQTGPCDPSPAGSLPPHLPNSPAPGPPRTTGSVARAAPARPLPGCSGRPAAAPTVRVRRARAEPPSHVCPIPRPPPELSPRCPRPGGLCSPGGPSSSCSLTHRGPPVPPARALPQLPQGGPQTLRSPPFQPLAGPGAARLCLSSGPLPSGCLRWEEPSRVVGKSWFRR